MVSRLLKQTARVIVTCGLAVSNAMAQDKVVIGHFGNPTPMQLAAANREFAAATGWEIEWREFASAAEVVAAMAAGDVHIAELGSVPFTIAASRGAGLQLFMIAQIIGDAESLIVRDGVGIDTIEALEGKRLAVPFGSTAHFSLMGTLYTAGLTERDVVLVDLSPDRIETAWRDETIDAAFVWQPVQSRLLATGRVLVGAGRSAEWGYLTFDGWVVDSAFAARNTAKLAAFVKVMDDANSAYLEDPGAWTADSAPVRAIAEKTGIAPDRIPEVLKGYTFLPVAKQTGPAWFGGSIKRVITYTTGFLTAAGIIEGVGADYEKYVNTELTQAAME